MRKFHVAILCLALFMFGCSLGGSETADPGNYGDDVVETDGTLPEVTIDCPEETEEEVDDCEVRGPWGCDPNYVVPECDTNEECQVIWPGGCNCLRTGDFACNIPTCYEHECVQTQESTHCDFGCDDAGCREPTCETVRDCPNRGGGCHCDGFYNLVCSGTGCVEGQCDILTETRFCDLGCENDMCNEPEDECQTDADCDDDNTCTSSFVITGSKAGDQCIEGVCVSVPTPNYGMCGPDGALDYCVDGVCTHFEQCNDKDACTTDFVTSDGMCYHEQSGDCPEPDCKTDVDCNDHNACTSGYALTGDMTDHDQCVNGICYSAPVPNYKACGPGGSLLQCFDGECTLFEGCNDHDSCTYDFVDSDGLCVNTLKDECVEVECETAWDCNDQNACTDNYCWDGTCTTSIILSAIGVPCGEMAICTEDGSCDEVECIGDVDCDDGVFCTLDSCDETDYTCVHETVENCIPPMTECFTDDDCAGGFYGPYCVYSPVEAKNYCQECLQTGNFPDSEGCADGESCYWGVLSASDGLNYSFYWCSGCHFDPECDDGDPCTMDECDTEGFQMTDGVCSHTAMPDCEACDSDLDCDDGSECTDDHCFGGTCAYMSNSCDDGDPCTMDDCKNAQCHNTELTYCIACAEDSQCSGRGFCLDSGDVLQAGNCGEGRCELTTVECEEGTTCDLDSFGDNMWSPSCKSDLPDENPVDITCVVTNDDYPFYVLWFAGEMEFVESGTPFTMPITEMCSWAPAVPVFDMNCTDTKDWGGGDNATLECDQVPTNLPHPSQGDQGKRKVLFNQIDCSKY